jgi:[ribosomal protein S5]-alanine N-acetyltransferase
MSLNKNPMLNPTLTTERMTLSPLADTEAEELYHLWAKPAVRKYLCDDRIVPLARIQAIVRESVAAFQNHKYGLWVARLHEQNAIIGFCGYWPFFDPPEIQLIYGLDPEHWRKGLATEMARAMLDYGFQKYGFEVIRASADVPNQASIALMERLGMKFEKRTTINGLDLVFYQIE